MDLQINSQRFLKSALSLLVVVTLLQNVSVAQKQHRFPPGGSQEIEDLQKGVRWIYTIDNPLRKPTEIFTGPLVPIGHGEYYAPAAFFGAKTCGLVGTLYALAGREDLAMEWLLAPQAHNPSFQALMLQYPDYVIHKALEFEKEARKFGYVSSSGLPVGYGTGIYAQIFGGTFKW